MSVEKRVCVTGASGYIASHLIEQLIQKGYKVHGTVRSLANEEKIKHLRAQFSADLELFEADLMKIGSFDEVVKGCDVVFHTASPFQLNVEDPIKDLVEPALQGTLNVLESAKKAGITRVIVTSSIAAIVGDTKPEGENIHSEANWNLESTPTNGVSGYRYSKRVAEEAAWKFAKENDLQLSTINPAFVLGPPLSNRSDSTSIKTAIALLSGVFKNGAAPPAYGCVDVRDVALAHIRSYERPECIGSRFMATSEQCYDHMDLSNTLKAILTEDIPSAASLVANLPTDFASPPKWKTSFDTTKLREELGITPMPLRQSLRDMVQFLLDAKLVSI